MKQVVQDLRSGAVQVLDVPEPQAAAGYVLVTVEHSLISSGTERSMVDLGGKSLLGKARARPDLVRRTLDVARSDGLGVAMSKVRGKLDQYAELGYSCSGRVLDAGGDRRFAPGARVACIGAGYANHAGVVSVPVNLVIPLPEEVASADAAFAAPAAIALHALRLAGVEPGAVVAVVGLGLIGQLAGRLLAASGCTPIGSDPRADRRALFGVAGSAADAPALVERLSRERLADAVLVCAASASSEPVGLAAELARDRATVVVVGDVALELDRRIFYEKELSLVVARSYGPGRYERSFEEGGLDLPPGYVRWTESRNVEAVLDLLAAGSLRVTDLVTHRFAASEAGSAYDVLQNDSDALGILLEFEPEAERQTVIRVSNKPARAGALRIGIIGAGEFTRSVLVPAVKGLEGVELVSVTARSGASARSLADRFEIPVAGTDWRAAMAAEGVDALMIATPHAEHAQMVVAGLEAGKAVLVEKPLAIDWEGLTRIQRTPGLLLVGHNRRFAPLAQRARAELDGGPVVVQIRVVVGPLDARHWLNDLDQGGRVLGEISHFVDLASFFAADVPSIVQAVGTGESLLATLSFRNGSTASIAYVVSEQGSLPKERIEVFGKSGAIVIDDFRRLEIHGNRQEIVKERRDKGHANELAAFVAAARGESPLPVSFEDQVLITAATLALFDSARTGAPVGVRLPA